MDWFGDLTQDGKTNFIFIGGAGSGKSEIALNFAALLARRKMKPVHFFDMDMTKPLFRSRDMCEEVRKEGVIFHFEEQYMDAPTQVGGVSRLLRDEECFVLLDVGGDDIGARSIGGFAQELNRARTKVFYVLNAFRPWTLDIDQIDLTLSQILGVSHINLSQLALINNPNLGWTTTAEEVREGADRMDDLMSPYLPTAFYCVREELFDDVSADGKPWLPLHLYLTYAWNSSEAE